MRKYLLIPIMAVMVAIVFSSVFSSTGVKTETKPEKNPGYIIIAWNDLGMHCSNKYFINLAILPPYNNQHAQLIRVGDSINLPQVLAATYHATYEIPGNTYSVGKTDFWTYANALFGVTLADNIGLTGVGLSGVMNKTGNYFHVEGIPNTPYTDSDLVNEHPYQLTLIRAYDTANMLLASTQSVIPVSNELSCISSGCHTSEAEILDFHEDVPGFDPLITPVLCARCHKDNALGMPGTPGTPVFSEAIHGFHAEKTSDCYKCHPGPATQCFRDIMKQKGMVCQDCHGTVANIANTIQNGREAWLQEPDCGTNYCHGPNHASEPGKLFRNSKGHSNIFCSGCHGSPHAILPTLEANDNVQNISLQGFAGTLKQCVVCHGVNPTGPGPHGIYASVINYEPSLLPVTALMDVFPNPVTGDATINFVLSQESKVTLEIFNRKGQQIRLLLKQHMQAGTYHVSLNTDHLSAGVYFYKLTAGAESFTKKMVLVK